jgi:putative tryptophan/tyrosine transport system substrate-binding protein
MRRREFVTLIGGAAAALPLVARAQPQTVPLVGYLANATPSGFAHFAAAFRRGLSELGYIEGRTVTIDYRWAEGQDDRLPALVADLIAQRAALIMATGGSAPALAAKAVTTTIPIVFTGGADPVKAGLVASLNRPGGNATGVVNIEAELTGKRLELLRALVPTANLIAVLFNPASPTAETVVEAERATRPLGHQILVLNARSEGEFDAAFAAIVERHATALFVSGDPLFTSRRAHLISLAAQHAIPASYSFRDFPLSGGLVSYGADLLDVHRHAGVYAGRILKGEKPADLPILRPTKFNFVINQKTANALGLVVPDKRLPWLMR